MKKLLLLSLLLCQPVWASAYEYAISDGINWQQKIYEKLDEISKKLDKPEETYINTGGPLLFKKENLKKGKLS